MFVTVMFRNHFRVVLLILLVFVILFGILFPLFLTNRPFSVYYNLDKNEALEKIRQRNLQRIIDAETQFEHYKEHAYNFNFQRLQSGNLYLLITIITTSRIVANERLEYLIQSVISTHQDLVENENIHAALLICNVDKNPLNHKEATSLSQYFPTIVKKESNVWKDIYEKEKDDYMYCLEQSQLFKPQYILMVEDDAVPYRSMLPYLQYILDNKLTTKMQRGERVNRTEPWLALKLYYPETWMGFGFETLPLLELTGLCCVFASLFAFIAWAISSFLHMHCNMSIIYLIMIMGIICGLFIAYGVGRQNLFELCRLHPMFFHIYPAPGCCTPATLYPIQHLNSLINYLNYIQCKSKFGLDLAIDEYAHISKLKIYQVVPNLFHHIGFYSTLTSNKERYQEFLI